MLTLYAPAKSASWLGLLYTTLWWDYRQLSFPRNHGLRIDHILVTSSLAARCSDAWIDREARKGPGASDHAPVVASFAPAGVALS